MINPPLLTPSSGTTHVTLSDIVEQTLEAYFEHLGNTPSELYHLVMEQVEQPLLASTLAYTEGNQSRTAKILGISRTTLRKKLLQYDLVD